MLIDLVIKYYPGHSVSTNLIDDTSTPMPINSVEQIITVLNSNNPSNDITRNSTLVLQSYKTVDKRGGFRKCKSS